MYKKNIHEERILEIMYVYLAVSVSRKKDYRIADSASRNFW